MELDCTQSPDLLAGVPLGRVVFSHQALPAIRPVNHAVDDAGCIVFRTDAKAAVLGPVGAQSMVVFEAGDIAPVSHTGWSVIVTGFASLEGGPLAARADPLDRRAGGTRRADRPGLVTGSRLLRPPAP